MATFLNWKEHTPRSPKRILYSLMSSLSKRWYPVHVIRSEAYDILNIYAQEISDSSQEVFQTFQDLRIYSTRTTPIVDRDTLKLFDNWGHQFGLSRRNVQDIEVYDFDLSLQSYKHTLKHAYDAFINGTTVKARSRVGHSFTGVAPIAIDPVKEYKYWKLSIYEGEIIEVGEDFIIGDTYIPNLRSSIVKFSDPYLFVYDSNDELVASEDAESGMRFVYSKSKLEHNTIIKDAIYQYSGHEISFFIDTELEENEAATSTFKSSIELLLLRILRADIQPFIDYTNAAVYWRPDEVLDPENLQNIIISDHWIIHRFGFLQYVHPSLENGGSVLPVDLDRGITYDGDVLSIPSNMQDAQDLQYDWLAVVKNDTRYQMEVRTYPNSNIPPTVGFQPFDNQPLPPLEFPRDPDGNALKGAYYSFNSAWDGSGNFNNLKPPLLYNTDWSEYELGGLPFSPDNWIYRGSSINNYSIVQQNGNNVLNYDNTLTGSYLLHKTDSAIKNFDFMAVYLPSSTSRHNAKQVFNYNLDEDKFFAFGMLGVDTIALFFGTSTVVTESFSQVNNVSYKQRVRREGNTIKCTVWKATESEPSPQITYEIPELINDEPTNDVVGTFGFSNITLTGAVQDTNIAEIKFGEFI